MTKLENMQIVSTAAREIIDKVKKRELTCKEYLELAQTLQKELSQIKIDQADKNNPELVKEIQKIKSLVAAMNKIRPALIE
jgi:hypothetical protein